MRKRAIALSLLVIVSTLSAPAAADSEEDHTTSIVVDYAREEAKPSRSGGRLPIGVDYSTAKDSVVHQYKVQHEQHTISLAEIEAAERKAEEERIEEERRKEQERKAREAAEKERQRQEAEEAKKREAERQAQKPQKQPSNKITPPPATQTPTGSSVKDYARSKVGAEQFQCLNLLWEKESNWNHTAMNPSSGAYGIPQSLPGDKMASAGSDWRTNPYTQIDWGISYISNRYGTPCAAWSHSQQHNWY